MDQLDPRTGAAEDSAATFLGRGIVFPMRVDHTGAIALTSGADDIDRSIRVVLATAPGERVMRPLFGCAIWDLVFEPINANTVGAMEGAVRDAVAQWEPRVTVESVEVAPDPDNHALVHISIVYQVRATNDRRNLVYPFYVIPVEED